MNTENRVLSNLSKFDLKTQKVELSILDDLKKMQPVILADVKRAIANAKDAENAYQKANKENQAIYDNAEKMRKEMYNKLADARRQAKDLGIELPKEWYDLYDSVSDAVNKIPVSNLGNIFPI